MSKKISPEEQKRRALHGKRTRLFSEINRQQKGLEAEKEALFRALDPEYAKLQDELRAIDARLDELRQKQAELEFSRLSKEEQRIWRKIGWAPEQRGQVIRRTTGTFTTVEE